MSKKDNLVYEPAESFEDLPQDKLKKLKDKLKQSQKEKEEYLAGWQRARADLVNFRRRQEESIKNLNLQNKAALIKDMLPLLDTLSQAATDKNIALILKQLLNILQSQGLKEIKALGEKFNPQLHEAVERIKSKEQPDTIVAEVQKGYLVDNQVLRAAKVKIAK